MRRRSILQWSLLLLAALVVPACGKSRRTAGTPPPPGGGPPPAGAPAAPQNAQAAPGDRMVTLTWAAVAGAAGYTIRSATDQGGPYGLVEAGFTGTMFIDDTLDNGTTYYYVISASNSAGEGPQSVEVSATPQGTAPTQNWNRFAGNPIFTGSSAPTAWDAGGVLEPSIVRISASSWMMYYTGVDPASGSLAIGRAISPDGVTWTRSPATPVLVPGSVGAWDASLVACPIVILDGSTWRMWYAGSGGAGFEIGYATSSDGVTWVKTAAQVLSTGDPSSWDDFAVSNPRVLFDGSIYRMWYSGVNMTGASGVEQIGTATSPDGVTWTKYPSPVLSPSAGAFDARGISDLMVVREGAGFQGWYGGVAGPGADAVSRIGFATSPDGINWTKQSTPVLDVGAAGSWDDRDVLRPFVLREGTQLRMWFTGRNTATDRTAIGFATRGS